MVKTWTTTNGQKIRFRDLGDEHLVNILYMIEETLRVYDQQRRLSQYTATTRAIKQYPELTAEALKRGLFRWASERKQLDSIIKRAQESK